MLAGQVTVPVQLLLLWCTALFPAQVACPVVFEILAGMLGSSSQSVVSDTLAGTMGSSSQSVVSDILAGTMGSSSQSEPQVLAVTGHSYMTRQ